MTSPHPILSVLGIVIVTMSIAAFLIWVERRLLALWQDRYGPNRVGPFGLLQVLADSIKIFMKEDWIPPFVDRPVFVLAPAVVFITVLMSFAVLPVGPGIIVSDLNVGLLFFLAMSSLGVYSVVLAGWSSNNKYALLGGLRAAAQMLSYEVFMGLSLAGIFLMYTGTSVARVFFISAATFGAMSLYGYTTQRDLSQLGSFLFMGLIGVVLASLVNIFVGSSALQFMISVIGVLVFTGLTAWDTQRIKEVYVMSDPHDVLAKKALMGALALYLDFINLFVMLLQITGQRK